MRLDAGITNVASAGTSVQVNNVTNRVKQVQFKALAGNSGLAYVGVSDVSASLGYELSAGNTVSLNFGEFGGSVPSNIFYVDVASGGDKISWLMILEG
jgi:hypothetical protein